MGTFLHTCFKAKKSPVFFEKHFLLCSFIFSSLNIYYTVLKKFFPYYKHILTNQTTFFFFDFYSFSINECLYFQAKFCAWLCSKKSTSAPCRDVVTSARKITTLEAVCCNCESHATLTHKYVMWEKNVYFSF